MPTPYAQVCDQVWEFAAAFAPWYLSNRIMMWHVHSGTEGGSQELWRGSQVTPCSCCCCRRRRCCCDSACEPCRCKQAGRQASAFYAAHSSRLLLAPIFLPPLPLWLLQMWVWMAPNNLKAIWKVLVSENAIVKRLFNFEIGFTVSVPVGGVCGPADAGQKGWLAGRQCMTARNLPRLRDGTCWPALARLLTLLLPALHWRRPCCCEVQVTSKDDGRESRWTAFRRALGVTWPHLTYLFAFAAGFIYFIVKAAMGTYRWAGGRAACAACVACCAIRAHACASCNTGH